MQRQFDDRERWGGGAESNDKASVRFTLSNACRCWCRCLGLGPSLGLSLSVCACVCLSVSVWSVSLSLCGLCLYICVCMSVSVWSAMSDESWDEARRSDLLTAAPSDVRLALCADTVPDNREFTPRQVSKASHRYSPLKKPH